MKANDYADRRVEAVANIATVATVTGLALTLVCLLLVRLMNPTLFADASISISATRGDSANGDLITFGVFAVLFLAAGVLPALFVPMSRLLRVIRISVATLAALVVVYGLVQLLLPYLSGGSPDYLHSFYTLVGGWSLAGSWLVSLARVRSLSPESGTLH